MDTKLNTIGDGQGRPRNLSVTADPISEYIGARPPVSTLPNVAWVPGDRGYDTD